MDFKTFVDGRGRLKLELRLFDAKFEPTPITGAYTVEVAKPDGTVLCKASVDVTAADFTAKGSYKDRWHEVQCPADPGVDELNVTVKVTAKGDKDDIVLDRTVTVAAARIYERLPAKPKPPEKPPEKPAAEEPTPEKPAAEKPAAEKPAADKPAAEKPAAEKPAAEKPAAEKPAA